jgi:hypothetical protein
MAQLAANLLVLAHLVFILFVGFGGLLVLRWKWLIWVHLPAAAWGALIEFGGWICPLTPLENSLRQIAGAKGYSGGFIEHYLLPLIYPADLTRELQMILGGGVLLINLLIYGLVFRPRNSPRKPAGMKEPK